MAEKLTLFALNSALRSKESPYQLTETESDLTRLRMDSLSIDQADYSYISDNDIGSLLPDRWNAFYSGQFHHLVNNFNPKYLKEKSAYNFHRALQTFNANHQTPLSFYHLLYDHSPKSAKNARGMLQFVDVIESLGKVFNKANIVEQIHSDHQETNQDAVLSYIRRDIVKFTHNIIHDGLMIVESMIKQTLYNPNDPTLIEDKLKDFYYYLNLNGLFSPSNNQNREIKVETGNNNPDIFNIIKLYLGEIMPEHALPTVKEVAFMSTQPPEVLDKNSQAWVQQGAWYEDTGRVELYPASYFKVNKQGISFTSPLELLSVLQHEIRGHACDELFFDRNHRVQPWIRLQLLSALKEYPPNKKPLTTYVAKTASDEGGLNTERVWREQFAEMMELISTNPIQFAQKNPTLYRPALAYCYAYQNTIPQIPFSSHVKKMHNKIKQL